MTRQLQSSTAKFEKVNRRLLQNDLRPHLQKQQRQLQQTQYHLQNMVTSLVNSYRQRFAVACSKWKQLAHWQHLLAALVLVKPLKAPC